MPDLENDDNRVVDVVAAVIVQEDRVLLCQRPKEKRHGGLWEFPGGKLSPGESLFDAARRELLEELGVQVQSVRDTMLSVRDRGSRFEIHFVPTEIEGMPVTHEHDGLEWVSLDRLLDYPLAPSDLALAKQLQSYKATDMGG